MGKLLSAAGGCVVGAVVMFGLSAASAQVEGNAIEGCVTKNGSLRVLDSGSTCKSTETPISWSVEGPQGPIGPVGPEGPAGESGILGLAGLSCPEGESVTGFSADGELICTGGAPPADADGDGFDESVDCDDTNAAVNPGAAEVVGDGIDNDCDGEVDEGGLLDQDGDGFDESVDCDDTNAAVNPGAAEVVGDGIDNDCDGEIDEGGPAAG